MVAMSIFGIDAWIAANASDSEGCDASMGTGTSYEKVSEKLDVPMLWGHIDGSMGKSIASELNPDEAQTS